jgi:GDP-D-mannose dehydratase
MEDYKYILGQIRSYEYILQEISNMLNKKEPNEEEGKIIKFEFGNINIKRDWGWAEEYVKLIWNKMQKKEYNDKSIFIRSLHKYI